MNREYRALFAAVAVSQCLCGLAGVHIDDLGILAPPATLHGYTMTPFAPDGRPTGEGSALVSDVPLPAPYSGVITFPSDRQHGVVPLNWTTWSHGYSGDVYYNGSRYGGIYLPVGTQAFYFYVEPNAMASYDITVRSGNALVTLPVDGNGGARGFGVWADGGDTLDGVNISSLTYFWTSFAVGEFGIAAVAVPEPSTWLAGIGALGMFGLFGRKSGK